MKPTKKILRITSSVLLSGLLALTILSFSGCRHQTKTTYSTAKVTRGDIDVHVHGTGAITPASIQAVTASVSGKITQVYKNNGDSVAQGDNIVKITENLTGKEDYITAPAAGVISGGQYSIGSIAQTGIPVCMVQSGSDFNVIAAIDELDINSVAIGQSANINIDAVPDTTFDGTVTGISKLGDPQNGVTTFNITLSISNPSNIMDNMSASVDVKSASKQGVLLVPIEALQTSGKNRYITVITQSNGNVKTSRVKVTVGLLNDSDAEITTGLAEGDSVVLSSVTSTSKSNNLRSIVGGNNKTVVVSSGVDSASSAS